MNKQTVLHYQKAAPLTEIATTLFKADPDAALRAQYITARDEMRKYVPDIDRMSRKEIVACIAKQQRELERQMGDLEGDRAKLDALIRKRDIYNEITIWSAESGLAIEKPECPAFRDLRRAVADGRSIYLGKDHHAETPAHDFEKEVFRYAEVVLIEHDWASAFEGANVEDAEVRLPYNLCAFEFQFAGRRVIALATQVDTEIFFCPAISYDGLWLLFDFVVPLCMFEPDDDRSDYLIELIDAVSRQIRAACIALDAEVARTNVVRQPHSGSSRRHGQLPRPHHVVSLARRHARPLSRGAETSGRRVRLHFRRGHWRHFEDHKTWIKWMLVGDPDLGFVDKHYRL